MQRQPGVPRRASLKTQQKEEFDGGDYAEPPRLPSSTRRYDTRGNDVIRQGNRQIVVHYDEPPPISPRRRRFHWLFWVGVVMFIAVFGTWVVNNVGTWWINEQNNFNYGMPRTYQIDAVVFKNDTLETPTHVIALNLNGKIEIIVMPQGKSQNAKIYDGPEILAPNPSFVPVTVSFEDVDGSGRKAMLVHIETQTIVYPNDGNQFQTPKQ